MLIIEESTSYKGISVTVLRNGLRVRGDKESLKIFAEEAARDALDFLRQEKKGCE